MKSERKPISIDQMKRLSVDIKGQLYWDDEAVVTEQRIRLGTLELWLAIVVAIAAVVSAAWPIADHFLFSEPTTHIAQQADGQGNP